MTDISFEDLAVFGITEETLVEDRETVAHNMLAEDFLAHMGIDIPFDADDEFFVEADDYIAQFGIKGMKWGRRRARGADGRVVKSNKGATTDKSKAAGSKFKTALANRKEKGEEKAAAAAAKAAAKPKVDAPAPAKRSPKQMTTQELNDAINRLRLEQTYAQMTATQKPQWRKDVEEVAKNALKQNAQAYASKYLEVGVGALLKQAGVPSPQDIAARTAKK